MSLGPRRAISLFRTVRRQFQNGHNPQQAAGLHHHDARARLRPADARAARRHHPRGLPDQSSIPPARGVKPRATSRCEKCRRSPRNGLRPSLRRIRITDVMS